MLVQKLLSEAQIIDNKIIKIDHLINHAVDVKLLNEIAHDIADKAKDAEMVLTIETGGIALATLIGLILDIDVVYAKKHESLITSTNAYTANVVSFTKNKTYEIRVEKQFLPSNKKVLIVDDFLATGAALKALYSICEQAQCEVLLSAFIINKTFQHNYTENIYGVVNVKSLANNKIVLCD